MRGRLRHIAGISLRGSCAAAALVLGVLAAHAQQQVAAVADPDGARSEYERVTRDISLSKEKLAALAEEIAGVRKDNVTLTAAMIQAAKTEKKLAGDIDEITTRLDELKEQEAGIRGALGARAGVLAEVLGALQRMGLDPPPALLVRPEDALASVRSAILLGAVVPELREQTEILMADLEELKRVTASIEGERERLAASAQEQFAEQQRLSLLIAEKKRLHVEAQASLAAEQERAEALAARAGSLKDLIAGLEKQAASNRAEAEKKRAAEAASAQQEAEIAALPENNLSIVSPPFEALKGQLSFPVGGRAVRRYGGKDDNGGVIQGDTLATQSGAIVTSPADGQVLYAGAFRSYGQLLILDAGGGYHIVLSGMDRINVALGQSVLSGEPVGAMGESRMADSSGVTSAKGPELYVEFRKDGKPVDPRPWWTERVSGRTGNDT